MTIAAARSASWVERLDTLAQGERTIVPDESVPHRDLLPATLRDAAVLVPIRRCAGGPELLLTRRTSRLRHHAGEVSFPGGRVEGTDRGRLPAALREAEEEIGLPASAVRPLGCLSPVLTMTGFAMMPFVATVAEDAPLVACPREVDLLFGVPLAFALDHANFETRRRWHRGRMREFQVMRYREHFIWGATAAVMRDLAERLAGLPVDV